jgi:hypothetical protein
MSSAYLMEIPQQKSINQLEQEKASLLGELNIIDLEINRQRQKMATENKV